MYDPWVKNDTFVLAWLSNGQSETALLNVTINLFNVFYNLFSVESPSSKIRRNEVRNGSWAVLTLERLSNLWLLMPQMKQKSRMSASALHCSNSIQTTCVSLSLLCCCNRWCAIVFGDRPIAPGQSPPRSEAPPPGFGHPGQTPPRWNAICGQKPPRSKAPTLKMIFVYLA